jgi:hypothetical protein
MNHNDDPFNDLLNDESEPARPSVEFRDAMMRRTTDMLLRRRRVRRVAIACGVLFIYGAGMGTSFLIPRSGDGLSTTASVDEASTSPPMPTLQSDPAPVTAEMLGDWEGFSIRVAEAGPAERVRLLRAAGDWYMEEFDDIETAASCYSAMFAASETDTQLDLQERDNWLLASLKMARLEEKNHDENI